MDFEVLKRLMVIDRLARRHITQTVFSSLDEEFHIYAHGEGLEPATFSWGLCYDSMKSNAPEPEWLLDIMFAFPEHSALTMSYSGRRGWSCSAQLTSSSTEEQRRILTDVAASVCGAYGCSLEELASRNTGVPIATDEEAYKIVDLMAEIRSALYLRAGC